MIRIVAYLFKNGILDMKVEAPVQTLYDGFSYNVVVM